MSKHEHTWHLVRTYYGEGSYVTVQQLVTSPIDLSQTSNVEPTIVSVPSHGKQEYAFFLCDCGSNKEVKI